MATNALFVFLLCFVPETRDFCYIVLFDSRTVNALIQVKAMSQLFYV